MVRTVTRRAMIVRIVSIMVRIDASIVKIIIRMARIDTKIVRIVTRIVGILTSMKLGLLGWLYSSLY